MFSNTTSTFLSVRCTSTPVTAGKLQLLVKSGVQHGADSVTFQLSFSHLILASLQAFAVKPPGLQIDDKHEIHLGIAHLASEPAAHDKKRAE